MAHRVEILELGEWCEDMLGFDPRAGVGWLDWLATSSHRLAEVTGGSVFHDGLGELGQIRTALAWYPHDVWLYVLASQWRRIAQEEAFVGRCRQVGDELGARLLAARHCQSRGNGPGGCDPSSTWRLTTSRRSGSTRPRGGHPSGRDGGCSRPR